MNGPAREGGSSEHRTRGPACQMRGSGKYGTVEMAPAGLTMGASFHGKRWLSIRSLRASSLTSCWTSER